MSETNEDERTAEIDLKIARSQQSDEVIYLTKPNMIKDIQERIEAGVLVDSLAVAKYGVSPRALAALAAFTHELVECGMTLRPDYADLKIYRPMTEAEKAGELHDAQVEWETARQLYEKSEDTLTAPAGYGEAAKVRRFCEAEGLPLPWEGVE